MTNIKSKLPQVPNWNPPTWWRTPEEQLERARQLWPNAVLPKPPANFVSRTETEVLLLHVPDSFDSLRDKVVAPTGYTKYRWESVKADKWNLRLTPNKVEYTEPIWLAFDPERGRGERPNSFWGQADCAASEVFSALIQFPEWPLAWLKDASMPFLSGYQIYDRGGWISVPRLFRWDDDHQLRLVYSLAIAMSTHCSSPSIRMLN